MRPNLTKELIKTIQASKSLDALRSLVNLTVHEVRIIYETNNATRKAGRQKPAAVAATRAYLKRTKAHRAQYTATRYRQSKARPEEYAKRLARIRELRRRESHHQWRRAYLERPDVRERNRAREATRRQRPQVRIAMALRSRLANAIRGTKAASTMTLLGCSSDALISHLSDQLQPGMTWQNYGIFKRGEPRRWHLDHIIPCTAYDLTDANEQRKCFNWRNLRPSWGDENTSKSDKVMPELVVRYGIVDLVPNDHPFSYAFG